MSLTHIETIELGSSQASITFSSIPQDYDDLVIVLSLRSDSTATFGDQLETNINGGLTNTSSVRLRGTGSVADTRTTSNLQLGFIASNGDTSNTFGSAKYYISNYTASTGKSISADIVSEDNNSLAYQVIAAALWDNSAAITSLEFYPTTGPNFITGSIASLYGVTAGGDGTVSTT